MSTVGAGSPLSRARRHWSAARVTTDGGGGGAVGGGGGAVTELY